MPKTKDAFAFRDFDAEHILWQRLHDCLFKDDTLADLYDRDEDYTSDEYLLNFFQSLASGYIKNGDFRQAELFRNWFQELWNDFDCRIKKRIERHIEKLGNINRKLGKLFLSTDDVPLESTRRQMRRTCKLMDSYSDFLEVAEKFDGIAEGIYEDLKWSLDYQAKSTFAYRLREARKKAGLTQKQVADKLGITQGGYTKYENARIEPTITTLYRLSRILKRPTDWLLGLEE